LKAYLSNLISYFYFMNKFSFTLLFVTLYIFGWGQAPSAIPYQAVMRNADGSAMVNTAMSIRFCIRENSTTGTITYQEIQSATSNSQGLVSCTIGNGTATIGSFNNIQWGNGNKYLQVDINLGSTWIFIGTEPLNSVPYALYANNTRVSTSTTGDTLTIGNHAIIIPGISAANHILGCTNPQACNYNANATDDNGSCHITGNACDDANASTTNDQYNANCECIGSASYTVGSQGPAGGYIFYDKGSYSNGWRYLEVYPTTVYGPWGCQGTSIAGTSAAVGTGETNTALILAGCTTAGTAAQLCDNFSINGFTDWFLPSSGEMDLIHDVLFVNNIGNIPDAFHWTSTQYAPQGTMYGVLYDNDFGNSDIQAKGISLTAIPVRGF
jgi:hypothetical protein